MQANAICNMSYRSSPGAAFFESHPGVSDGLGDGWNNPSTRA